MWVQGRQITTYDVEWFVGLTDYTRAMKIPGKIFSKYDAQILVVVNTGDFCRANMIWVLGSGGFRAKSVYTQITNRFLDYTKSIEVFIKHDLNMYV